MTVKQPSIFDMPFCERRYIAVLSNDEFDTKKNKQPDLKYGELLQEVIPLLIPGGVAFRLIALAATGYSKDRIFTSKVPVPTGNGRHSLIPAIPLREANRFMFIGGCAEIGKVYAANPLADKTYYSIESYNDDMVDHKLSELERILNGLGATKYQIQFNNEDQYSAQGEGKIRRYFSGKASAQLSRARAKRFERSGTALGREPVLPVGLVWLEREPSWQALVESRLQHGRQEFGLRVELERDLQISAKISADLKVAGFDVGAAYKKRMNFDITVSGTFGV